MVSATAAATVAATVSATASATVSATVSFLVISWPQASSAFLLVFVLYVFHLAKKKKNHFSKSGVVCSSKRYAYSDLLIRGIYARKAVEVGQLLERVTLVVLRPWT